MDGSCGELAVKSLLGDGKRSYCFSRERVRLILAISEDVKGR